MALELPERLLPLNSIKELKCVTGMPKRKQLFVILEKAKLKTSWPDMFRLLIKPKPIEKIGKYECTGEFVVTTTGDFKTINTHTFAGLTRQGRECFIEARTPQEAFDKFLEVKKYPNEVLHKENEKYLRAG